MRKSRILAFAFASLPCLAPSATAAAPNVVYTAIGTFATTVVSGTDTLRLAGQPFSIAILASESLKPTTHTKTSATYTNVYLEGTIQSAPPYAVPIASAGATLTLQLGAAGGPDQASVQANVSVLGAVITLTGTVTMPPGTLTTLAIRPFTAPVAFTTTNASATYACNFNCGGTTTLAIAGGSVNGALGVTALYSFTGQNGDGAYPYSGLTLGKHGTFYGTTYQGGTSNYGTVFELTPPASPGAGWTETVLYSFSAGSDGANPEQASLVLGPTGILYGTTFGGGTASSGTVFELTPPTLAGGPWKETVLYSFNTQSGDGWNPGAALLMGHGGVLYGTTSHGGTSGYGGVFALAPPDSPGGPWKEKVLYSFSGQNGDGASPLAPLVTDANGSLYGTTESGGASNLGTVFELTPPATAGSPWTETVLHSFTQNGDGAYPYAGLTNGPNGSLYGTTASGGASGVGAVFELTPPPAAGGAWTESILYSFTGRPVGSLGSMIGDGATPYSGLVMDATGALYGTTSAGGAANGGAAFKLTPPSTPGGAWTETVLTTFFGYLSAYGSLPGPVGTIPAGGLVFGPKGQLYGAAEYGGNGSCSAGCGTLVELQP